jgi:hypothetical protein
MEISNLGRMICWTCNDQGWFDGKCFSGGTLSRFVSSVMLAKSAFRRKMGPGQVEQFGGQQDKLDFTRMILQTSEPTLST